MTGRRRYRRRRVRLYLSERLGCLGCSVPLAMMIGTTIAIIIRLAL